MEKEANAAPFARLERVTTKGNLWLYILSALRKKKIYAYGLRDGVEREFGWKPSLIMSYVVLYKLEHGGFIRSAFEGRRKYYSITEKGRKLLRKGKTFLRSLAKKL